MNKYLEKIASSMNDTKSDLVHTGTIFGAGLVGTGAAMKLGQKLKWTNHAGKMTALGGVAGLLSDYAAVKLNNRMDKNSQV